jgi:hypothetical protein
VILRVSACALLSVVAICGSFLVQPTARAMQDSCLQVHDDWVRDSLIKMDSVRPGMTREQVMKVFTTEGGLSNGLRRTFVSRDCSYFKIDVEFKAVGRPDRDSDGRVTLEEDSRDIIVRVSLPYLQFAIGD